ncbi:hypothetical protein G7Z17_g1534 [Cylindrodendrum hubeiense]|uniref:DUF7702 domain-containing protein n=1 Tax=Cylindrodendrum hubeiense TaxID=595255 RepID=A0A9P5HI78_9HYPO|nr:hypothetical protein G7Z17_g1534 [Cylindrodendrum hubeiense]
MIDVRSTQLPSASKNNLAIADLAIHATILFPVLWIAFKHGKLGMLCWPIFISYFPLRFVSDIYQIIHRNEPELPNTVAIMTNAGSLACLTLTIIGIIYEINNILPLPPKQWKEKIILGITHLANTVGIGLATYGGAPSATTSTGVVSANLNKIGNCMMLFVMFALCWWLWSTGKRLASLKQHPNFTFARHMYRATCAALPFQLVRIGYNLTYALTPVASLDPVMGTFATRFILMFIMQLGVVLAVTAGGWLSIGFVPVKQLIDEGQGNDMETVRGLV